jgi:hypothetical protein
MKLLAYEAKISAINDCLAILKTNERIDVTENIKTVRKLSNKQFKLIIKRNKVAHYLHMAMNNLYQRP